VSVLHLAGWRTAPMRPASGSGSRRHACRQLARVYLARGKAPCCKAMQRTRLGLRFHAAPLPARRPWSLPCPALPCPTLHVEQALRR
jgi:hypothetical protein